MPFTNENNRYRTDTNKGHPHGPGQPRGSVFPDPIFEEGYSLWLEHVIELATGVEEYWLMWYDQHGHPTINVSAVLSQNDLRNLVHRFIKIP